MTNTTTYFFFKNYGYNVNTFLNEVCIYDSEGVLAVVLEKSTTFE